MADSWRSNSSRAERTARAVESMSPGTVKGRVKSAAPVRTRDHHDQDPDDSSCVWVDTEEPPEGEAPTGKLWFKLSEPV